MLTYRIHLLRHGRTQGNQEGRYIGRTDIGLSDEGVAELERLRDFYEYPKAEMVVTSPLQRCVQTSDILYPDTYTEQWEDFIECDFGQFEGKTAQELEGDERFREWIDSGMRLVPPGGESSDEMSQRVVRGMHRLFKRMMDESMHSVSLITHGGVITLLLYSLGLPKRDLKECVVSNGCGYTVLMTPQLWMRDGAFEIYGVAPYGLTESELRSGPQSYGKEGEEYGGENSNGW